MQPAFNPTMWGPGVWFMLHLSALRYPEKPAACDKKNYMAFIKSLQFVLPCEGCCKGFQKIIETTKFGAAHLSSRNALFKWTVDAHNMVNAKLGKRVRDDWRAWMQKYMELSS